MFDEDLVQAIVGGEDSDRGLAELGVGIVEFGVKLALTRGHGWPLPGPVSYTHLDVYKRQGPREGFWLCASPFLPCFLL